jgi:hypothetical protein
MADRHRAQMLLTLLGGTPMSGSALAEAGEAGLRDWPGVDLAQLSSAA